MLKKVFSVGVLLVIMIVIVAMLWSQSVGASDLPPGIEYPTITRTTECIGTNLTVSQWLVDPSLGDEWASENSITYLQNAELNIEDGDQSPTYGVADWLFDHSAINQVTIEVTSNLYHNESIAYTYVKTIEFISDPSCKAEGLIRDVSMTPMQKFVWSADSVYGEHLGIVSIALNQDNILVCDEVVDVTNIGSLYANALDWYCRRMAIVGNETPIFVNTNQDNPYYYDAIAYNTGERVGHFTVIQLENGRWWCDEITVYDHHYQYKINDQCLATARSLNNNSIYLPVVLN